MDRAAQLRKFIEAQPDEAFPRYALALELKGAGDAAGASRELAELLQRKPDYLAAYLQQGMLLQFLERIADSRSVLLAGQEVARKRGDTHTLSELTAALDALPR